jgi:hypothetical protein
VDICKRCNTLLVKEILSELSSPNIAKMPNVKNVGLFIDLMTKAHPELIIANLPVINNQIDSPAHQSRYKIVYFVLSVHSSIFIKFLPQDFLIVTAM